MKNKMNDQAAPKLETPTPSIFDLDGFDPDIKQFAEKNKIKINLSDLVSLQLSRRLSLLAEHLVK